MAQEELEFDDLLFRAGDAVGKQARSELSELVALREGLLRLTAAALESKLVKPFSASDEQSQMLALVCHFLQGSSCTGELILEGFYSKAAAALKQDIELLARFGEIEEGSAREGRTPQMRGMPKQARVAYGTINQLSHPSVRHLLDRHVTSSSENGQRSLSVLPTYMPKTTRLFYRTHLWLCIEFCYCALKTLIKIHGEPDCTSKQWWQAFCELEDSALQLGEFGRATEQDFQHSRKSEESTQF